MITEDNQSMVSTAESIYTSNADEIIRKRCRDREDFYIEQAYLQNKINDLEKSNAEKDSALAEKESMLAEKNAALAEKDATLAEKEELLRRYIEQFGALK